MEEAKFIIKAVDEIISPVYLVGGSVRDILLNKEPKDYDFTTPLEPDEVEARIKAAGRHCNPRGKRFGTLGFKVAGKDGKFVEVEVTTFRHEQYTPGSRKPQVEFVGDLKSDLSRRDFTINAIALDSNFEYIDPFGGRLEILAKKIKAVGEATDRFKDDPLRMLRAARFAAQLGFDVDPNMVGKIRKMAYTILDISRERWVQEIDKLLLTDDPMIGLEFLYSSSLLRYMMPEVCDVYKRYNLRETLSQRLSVAPKDADIRWAILLYDVAYPFFYSEDIMDDNRTVRGERRVSAEIARGLALRLKFSSKRQQLIDEYTPQNKQSGYKHETELQVPTL